jgi:hypothetical protein
MPEAPKKRSEIAIRIVWRAFTLPMCFPSQQHSVTAMAISAT